VAFTGPRPCVLPVSISAEDSSSPGFADAQLTSVGGMTLDHDGSVLLTETDLHRVVRLRLSEELPSGGSVVESSMRQVIAILRSATVTEVAGSRREGLVDGDTGTAEFSSPIGLLFDASTDSVYIADAGNSAVRVLQGGRVRTLDLNGPGGGPAAALVRPTSIAMASHAGDMYVAEPHRDDIRLLLQANAVVIGGASDGSRSAGRGVTVSTLLRYTFVAAAGVFLVLLVASGRARRAAEQHWRRASSPSSSPSSTPRLAARAPKHWVQNQTF
jgi:DNA-binding beta-propeller fold protein YncE